MSGLSREERSVTVAGGNDRSSPEVHFLEGRIAGDHLGLALRGDPSDGGSGVRFATSNPPRKCTGRARLEGKPV